MNRIEVATKDLKHIVRATFPEYKRKKVIVVATENVTFHDVNWSGGTKSIYKACTVDGRPVASKVDMGGPAPWENPFEGKTVALPEGAMVVQGGYFCGKVSLLYVYVNPANMPKFLTA